LEFWNKFTGPIGLVINALLSKIGLGDSEIKKFEAESGKLGSLLDQLRVLQKIAAKVGYGSVYVLVDKVDENVLTSSSATSSYEFIKPLITDLQILELSGYGFKFFLWGQLRDSYQQASRPDRVKYYTLEWKSEQLVNMLSERLKAYSRGQITSLNSIAGDDVECDLDQLVCIFAEGSPRTVVRICKEIFDQQSELDSSSVRLSREAVAQGFDQIANNISNELFKENIIKDLQRTKRCDFTIRHVYSNVFKFTQQAGLNKIRAWQDAGAVDDLGEIQETKGARPSNHYGLKSLLLAKFLINESAIFEFSKNKLRKCSGCKMPVLRDWELRQDHRCHLCQGDTFEPIVEWR
jgi:hypothetical protein